MIKYLVKRSSMFSDPNPELAAFSKEKSRKMIVDLQVLSNEKTLSVKATAFPGIRYNHKQMFPSCYLRNRAE